MSPDEQRLILYGIPWESYVAIGDALMDYPIRMTYDRGTLEFITKSLEHEGYGPALALLVATWAAAQQIPSKGYGGPTLRRRDRKRGMEPDACFYFRNLERVRGKKEVRFPGDPPPDLAIEIEVSRSALDRMGILAALGIPEVWRFNGRSLRVYHLNRRGRYKEYKRSLNLPGFPLQELVHFIQIREEEDDTAMLAAFQEWIDKQNSAD
jgi:Uma2 family endonuclease